MRSAWPQNEAGALRSGANAGESTIEHSLCNLKEYSVGLVDWWVVSGAQKRHHALKGRGERTGR